MPAITPGAVAEAKELSKDKNVNAFVLYDLACVCSLASAAVKPAMSGEKAEADKLKEQYQLRALELLRQAIAKGFKDVAHVKRDPDLDALRQREDFKKLIAELEAEQEKKE